MGFLRFGGFRLWGGLCVLWELIWCLVTLGWVLCFRGGVC